MDLYNLPAVLREPSDETEGKYLAEIPDLPGCRAWGHTAAQALESLQSVAHHSSSPTATEATCCRSK